MIQASWFKSAKSFLTRPRRLRRSVDGAQRTRPGILPQEHLEKRLVMTIDVLPDSPTDVVATPGDVSVVLAWMAPTDNGALIEDYVAEYSTDDGLNWQSYDDGVSADPFMTIPNLVNGTPYIFHVAAVNEFQQSGVWSLGSNTAVPAGLPDAPTDLLVSAGDGAVNLTWNSPVVENGSAVTSYVVEYSADGETWVPVPDAATDSSLKVTGLHNGTSYVFHVAAVNDVGQGVYSAVSDAATPAGLPSAPHDVTASAGDGSVDLTWVIPTDNGASITDFVVEYSVDNGLSWNVFDDGTSTAAFTTVSGLANGTSYLFHVAAINDVGQGDSSEASIATTPVGIPDQPTSLLAAGGNRSVTLTWSAPTNDGGSPVLGYIIEYRQIMSAGWTAAPNQPDTTATTVTGLTNGVTYLFRVAARTATSTSDFTSDTVVATPLATPTRLLGRAFFGTSSNGTVSLSWIAPSMPAHLPITGYVIQGSSDGGRTWWLQNDVQSRLTTAVVGSLTTGTSYMFRVAAVTAAGQGAFSAPSAALTPMLRSAAAVPSRPTALTAVGMNGTITLSWTAPPSNSGGPAIDYVIRLKFDQPGAKWFTIPRTASANPMALVKRLIPGRIFTFQVAARNLNGVGAFSDSVSVRS